MRIFVADDEAPIREWFRFIVSNFGTPDWTVETATNGGDAYEKILAGKPDVAFIDIKMPGMDGISLIGTLKELVPKTVFIILTNHAEFSYAKKAISIGAYDYLLKSEITAESVENELAMINKVFFSDTPEGKRMDFLKLKDERQVLADATSAELDWRQGQVLGVIAVDRRHEQILLKLLKGNRRYVVGDYGEYVLGINARPFGWSLYDAKEELLKNEVSVGYSTYTEDLLELPEKLVEAVLALSNRFITGQQAPYFYDSLDKIPKLDRKQVRSELSVLLREVAYSKPEELLEKISGFFGKFQAVHPECIPFVKKQCEKLYLALEDRCLSEQPQQEDAPLLAGSLFLSIEEYRTGARTLLMRLEGETRTDSFAIDRAVQYIKQNYNKNLSLNQVSSLVFLSPEYFCRLFKSKTGVSFGTYLTAYRLERARQLLLSTDLKVSEIAEKVGYENTSYFIRQFKKHCGVTPEQERKLK